MNTPVPPTGPTPFGRDENHIISRRAVVLVCMLWLILAAGLARAPYDNQSPTVASLTSLRINPNQAQLWELTTLPRIGDTKAAAIIDYRNAQADDNILTSHSPTFTTADDLQHIRGIGPKTTARLEPYLRFNN